MSKRKKARPYEVHIRLGDSLRSRLATVCVLRREPTQSAYIRRALELQIQKDLEEFPSTSLSARPGAMLLSCTGTEAGKGYTFQPLTKTIGGERVWILSAIGSLPRAFGGGYAYLVDITAPPHSGGLDHRSVVIAADDIRGVTHPNQ